MAAIRKIEITNFRGIQNLSWVPSPHLNCIVGPGDSGKSTILDAVDICLESRRSLNLDDSDFYCLKAEEGFYIRVTIGSLPDSMLSLESYARYLRGFDSSSGEIEEEPSAALEPVITVELRADEYLQPIRSLFATRQGEPCEERRLRWGDAELLAPARIGTYTNSQFSWLKGSVLSRLAEEEFDPSGELAVAARKTRVDFGESVSGQLAETLKTVEEEASLVGVENTDDLQALLDPRSVSLKSGAVSIHDKRGVPLRKLGQGSIRLLTAALRQKSARKQGVLLADEVEIGLEPARIAAFLTEIGARNTTGAQCLLTTHSPVVIRELTHKQIWILRTSEDGVCELKACQIEDQGVLRASAEAFLSRQVMVCEGPTEVGFHRGLRLWRRQEGGLGADPYAVNAGGCSKLYSPASSFLELGYTTAVFRDDDVKPDEGAEESFTTSGGTVFKWREGEAIEDALFLGLPDEAVREMALLAAEYHGAQKIWDNLQSANGGSLGGDLESWLEDLDEDKRSLLGKAAKSGASWFKRIDFMERAALEIVGPSLEDSEESLRSVAQEILEW